MVVVISKKNVGESPAIVGANFCTFSDLSPRDILKNLEVKEMGKNPAASGLIDDKPSYESSTSLINTLARHFNKERVDKICIRSKEEEDAHHRSLKKKVYSILLSHRKEDVVRDHKEIAKPTNAPSSIKASEVEKLLWMTHVFCQQHRYDDANSLNKCLDFLEDEGQLKPDSDVRHVLKFLVALRNCGENQDDDSQPARITPRIVSQTLRRPDFLPIGPMQYGDTYEYAAEHQYYYMHFPPGVFRMSNLEQDIRDAVYPLIDKSSLDCSRAAPGTSISNLIFPSVDPGAFGKVLGAMVKEQKGEMSPDMILNLPELPVNPNEYFTYSHLAKTLSSASFGAGGSDEGYATRPSSRQISEEEEHDIWERVLKEPPLTQRHTWESVGHPPVDKEKLFLSEVGLSAAHNLWMVYQELWSNLHITPNIQPLCVTETSQLCKDILYLLSGVPSFTFPWCSNSQRFFTREGLCVPGITPKHLQTSLAHLLDCATYVRRLEMICTSPSLHTRKMLTQGLVFHAFIKAILSFLQVHRGKVLLLTGEKKLLHLLQKSKGLVRRVKFVASLCHLSIEKDETNSATSFDINLGNTDVTQEINSQNAPQRLHLKSNDNLTHSYVKEMHTEIPRGLTLFGELNSHLVVTKNREYLMLLVFIMKSACIPILRYLEDWIYEGICYDPGLEFMIDIDSASLLHRDRQYWTHGYTLKDLSAMPPFLREVLKEAFACGKAMNLLKICSPKHYLVCGNIRHPNLQLCISQEQLDQKHGECQTYGVQMDYLAARHQVTVVQKEEKLREEKKRLSALATREHTAAIKQIERKLESVRLAEINRKQKELMELKEEMDKASERKKERIQNEAEEDKKIALEQEKIEQKRLKQEEKLKSKVEEFYQEIMKAAENRETLARWKVDRCILNEARKRYITGHDWIVNPNEKCSLQSQSIGVVKVKEDNSVNMKIEVKPFFGKNEEKDTNANEGLLRIGHGHIDYVEPSPTEDSTSGCDMTVSRMSTSSDFVDTPHDENIPELEIDHEKSCIEKYEGINASTMKTKPLLGGNILGKKRQVFEPQILEHQSDASCTGVSARFDNLKIIAEHNQERVLREEFDLNMGNNGEANVGDKNANFSMLHDVQFRDLGNDDENGNLENSLQLAVGDQGHNNLIPEKMNQKYNSAPQIPVSTEFEMGIGDDNNGNIYIPRENTGINSYQESRLEAAIIKQKILSQEYQLSTLHENNVNLIRSTHIFSEGLMNKKKVLDTEYGMLETQEARSASVKRAFSYSRQTSSTSSSTYKSCHSYDRQTSASTVFSTPDEEKPVLIDQVGGEILKERGRSIHGHASDAVIHKLLWKNEPLLSPPGSFTETSIDEGILTIHSVSNVQPYALDSIALSGKELILDISGSALHGKPSTPENVKSSAELMSCPTTNELTCFPINFVRSIRAHLAVQSRLVNSSLLSEVLVQESLLDHFSALRAFLLLHDAHFARALIINLCTKIDVAEAPATLLTPVVMNTILSKSISESCWSTSPYADNLSFAVLDTPERFAHEASVLNCLELRYRVKWPHTLILDDAILASYSRLWKFLASLQYSIWAADDVFSYTSFLSREDKEGKFVKCMQFHQICLYCHEMHHFLLVIQAYVTSQVHQTSWSDFELKLRKKISSIDELYVLHSELVNSIVSRCFLNQNGAVVLKLIHEVFSLMLQFRSQLKSHVWQISNISMKIEHPAFVGLQKTYTEFKKHALFLHKMLEEEEK